MFTVAQYFIHLTRHRICKNHCNPIKFNFFMYACIFRKDDIYCGQWSYSSTEALSSAKETSLRARPAVVLLCGPFLSGRSSDDTKHDSEFGKHMMRFQSLVFPEDLWEFKWNKLKVHFMWLAFKYRLSVINTIFNYKKKLFPQVSNQNITGKTVFRICFS